MYSGRIEEKGRENAADSAAAPVTNNAASAERPGLLGRCRRRNVMCFRLGVANSVGVTARTAFLSRLFETQKAA